MDNQVKRTTTAPFDFYGLRIRELTPEDFSTASVAEVEVPPGVSHPAARSTKCDKLYICLKGMVKFQSHGQVRELQFLDTLLIKKSEWFRYTHDTSDIARMLLVHVPPFDSAAEELITS